MSVISGKDALSYMESFADREIQEQICGVDLTARSIERFMSSGSIDLDNSERRVAETEVVQFDEDGWAFLEMGAYLVTFNEIVRMPMDMMAFALPRSSLLRCGASLSTAVWDPGYTGRSQSLLVVHNPHGIRIKKNARLMQLVFITMKDAAQKAYSGAYQGENI
ncbi:MAG: deoxyuridine 5'-triphosphate nucleotidohydrolase [Methanothrix sp.]|nr:deoxyuridine 5'-triphosphate nucleotidohydrolase [Methanothrix sp.]MCX8206980.1 deoxyuridine 5'-triphosphate nucleotidohydrolase [Methanothrix sp.]